MKSSQNQQALLQKGLLSVTCFLMIFLIAGCRKPYEVPPAKVTTLVKGLMAPMGIEAAPGGNILVAETGTANNDGKVVIVRKDGGAFRVYDVIVNLSSIKNALSGEVEGPAHLLLDKGALYVLAGDYLYTIPISNFKPGDMPIDASSLAYEDIGSWVRDQHVVSPNDSHPYDLIKGPDGKIYIADAGANAIIKRKATNDYSIFATLPNLKNTLGGNPPEVQSVPTGIIFDGKNFLVSTLTGYPFPKGAAVVFKIALSGKVSVYADGFTTLTGIAQGNFYGHTLLRFANTSGGDFVAGTGALLLTDGHGQRTIADGINMPSAMKQINERTWYVSSLADGALLKVSYE